jgi:hypothetical protein
MVIPVNQNFLNRTSWIGFVESEFLELRLLEPEHFEGQHYCTKSDACALENSKILICLTGRESFTWPRSGQFGLDAVEICGSARTAELRSAGRVGHPPLRVLWQVWAEC